MHLPGHLLNGFATHCRFREGKRLSTEETEAFGKYFYHITAQRGSGEFALSHLLGPMAWARHPLEGRMHQMQVSGGHNYLNIAIWHHFGSQLRRWSYSQ